MQETIQQPEGGATVRSSDWLRRVIVFATYSILYEAIIWGIFGWAVFVKDRSGWWVLVAIICSGSQLKPKHFGIPCGSATRRVKPQLETQTL